MTAAYPACATLHVANGDDVLTLTLNRPDQRAPDCQRGRRAEH